MAGINHNTVSLKEYVDTLFKETDKRYEQRFLAQEVALVKSEREAERWRQSANEWREAMNDREMNFLSKNMGIVVGAVSIIATALAIYNAFK